MLDIYLLCLILGGGLLALSLLGGPDADMGGHSSEAELLAAQAAAAPIVEAVRQAGSQGERAYMLNMLPDIVEQLAASVQGMQLDRLTVIDPGDGKAIRSAGTAPPAPTGPAPTSSRASRTPDSGGYESCGGFPQLP